MPGQRSALVGGSLPWPYVEGLRLDEARHPLTLIAVGLYGRTLPPQNAMLSTLAYSPCEPYGKRVKWRSLSH